MDSMLSGSCSSKQAPHLSSDALLPWPIVTLCLVDHNYNGHSSIMFRIARPLDPCRYGCPNVHVRRRCRALEWYYGVIAALPTPMQRAEGAAEAWLANRDGRHPVRSHLLGRLHWLAATVCTPWPLSTVISHYTRNLIQAGTGDPFTHPQGHRCPDGTRASPQGR